MRRSLFCIALMALLLVFGCTKSEAVYQGKTVSQWVEALNDKDRLVRIQAAVRLGIIGPAAKDAVPALIEALKDKSSRVRDEAVYALGQIGPAANAAVPALKSLSESDPVSWVRDVARSALKQIEK
jgi:HEAT repeat protein